MPYQSNNFYNLDKKKMQTEWENTFGKQGLSEMRISLKIKKQTKVNVRISGGTSQLDLSS